MLHKIQSFWSSLSTPAKATLILGFAQLAVILYLLISNSALLKQVIDKIPMFSGLDTVVIFIIMGIVALLGLALSAFLVQSLYKWNHTVGWVFFVMMIAIPGLLTLAGEIAL